MSIGTKELLSCYLAVLVKKDRGVTEMEVESFLGGEFHRRDRPRGDVVPKGRQKPLPRGVGVGGRPELGGDGGAPAHIARGGE